MDTLGTYDNAFTRRCAENGLVAAYMFPGPWSWMNRGAVRVTDLVIDAIADRFGLEEGKYTLVVMGGSMGGYGALMFSVGTRHKVTACLAHCPCCDPLNSFAVHSGFGLTLTCKGDLEVDGHHSVEDCGIALGQALAQCVGDKAGIARFGQAFVPMDEALGFCALDISGRPYLVFDAPMPQPMCGQYDTCLTVEFTRALAVHAGLTLHLKCEYGENAHHITEALFKALARALKQAVAVTGGGVLSAKGVL